MAWFLRQQPMSGVAAAVSVALRLLPLWLLLYQLPVCLAFGTPTSLERIKQTLTFPDSQTGVTVHLVGSMHYNPHSIARTTGIIKSYGEAGDLGAVVVEQCPTRWEKVFELHPKGTLLRAVLDNEMQAAAETAEDFGSPLILGDEEIETVDQRVRAAFVQTTKDLFNPLGGGWKDILVDVQRAYTEAIDPSLSRKGGGEGNEQYLSLVDLLDPSLLLSSPVSFFRYPLAILIKAPVQGLALLGILTFLTLNGPAELLSDTSTVGNMSPFQFAIEMLEGAAAFTLETVFVARVFLTVLLVDRNEVLARNIRAECLRLAGEASRGGGGWWGKTSRTDKVCVAVLGMAHCNGVKGLLVEKESRV